MCEIGSSTDDASIEIPTETAQALEAWRVAAQKYAAKTQRLEQTLVQIGRGAFRPGWRLAEEARAALRREEAIDERG